MYSLFFFGFLFLVKNASGNTNFIACYEDRSTRIMADVYHDPGLTNNWCVQNCRNHGKSYAGTENGAECWCGNTYLSYPTFSDSECGLPCPGDSSQICGGPWRIRIHSTAYQGFGSWGSWGSCQTSCGVGTQQRSRSCNDIITSTCSGDYTSNQGCFTQPCEKASFSTSGYSFTTLSSYDIYPTTRHYIVFDIMGLSNANIMLSEVNSDSTNSYIVIIGGWSNTKYALRKGGISGSVVTSLDESNIMSSTVRKTFYIMWSSTYVKAGTVNSGVYEEKLSYTDSTYTKNYLLVSTYAGHTISWYFKEAQNVWQSTPDYIFVDMSRYGVQASDRTFLAFYARACSDCISAISSQNTWSASVSGYEIVIGGWTNTQSVIRTEYAGTELAIASTVNVLDCNQARSFYMDWSGSYVRVGTITSVALDTYSEFMSYYHTGHSKNFFLAASWSVYTCSWEFILDCGVPPARDGAVATASTTYWKSTATYSCKSGYITSVSGSTTVTCQENGRWQTTSFTCVRNCGTPASVSNANVLYSSTVYGATATYTCVTGYDPSAGTSITCQNTGWTSTGLTCVIKDCGAPPTKVGTTVSAPTTTYKSVATYSCLPGYRVDGSGSSTSTCDSTGTWAYTSYSCVYDCGTPSPITYATVSAPVTTAGNTATYTCNTGYNPTAGTTITCQLGGWTSTGLTCEINDCLAPPTLANSTNVAPTTTYQSTATYTCDYGYDPSTTSPLTITCTPTTWETITFSCDPHECGTPSPVLNAISVYVDTTYLHVATYNCNRGYDPSTTSPLTIMCGAIDWDPITFTCDPHDCGQPKSLNNSQLSVPSTVFPNPATYTCDPGHDDDPPGSSMQITCGPVTWDNITFWCKPRDCLPPINNVPHSTVSYTTTIFFTVDTSQVEWTCNTGYIIDPETAIPTVDCLDTGMWDTVTFTCIFNYCKNISKGYDEPALLDDSVDGLSGQMYFLNDSLYMVDCCGVISGWEFQPLVEDFIHFIVWRRNERNNPVIVGYNTVLVANMSELMNFTVPSGEKIAVQAFDQIGWYYEGTSPIPYADCSGSPDCPQETLHHTGPGDLPEGYPFDWDNVGTPLPDRAYSIKYYFTKNTELSFDKTTYNASIPNHWTTGRSVITLSLQGVDYAELATYTMVAHTNGSDGLFEIDKFGTVKIAGVLPVGEDDDTQFVYTVTAVDYCQNNATTTLSIETFNSPPRFGNLPALIEVEETVGTSEVLYTIEVTDPTNDSMCCTLEKTLPQSENFVIGVNQSVFLATSEKAYFSYKVVNSYLVRVCCQDRNYSAVGVLQVKVKKSETQDQVSVPGWFLTSLIASCVPVSVMFLLSCTLLFYLTFGL